MVNRFRRLIAPIIKEDEALIRAKSTLNTIVLALVAIGSAVLCAALFAFPFPTLRPIISLSIILAALLGIYHLNRRGAVQLASSLLVIVVWIMAVGLALTGGGIGVPGYGLSILPPLLAYLLIGRSAGVSLVIVNILTSTILYILASRTHLLPTLPVITPEWVWIAQISITLAVTWLFDLAVRNLRQTLNYSRQQEHLLAERNQILEREIAEREAAEEAYRSLVEKSLQGLMIYQDGKIIFANDTAARMTGYTPDELLEIDPLNTLVHPESRAFVQQTVIGRLNGDIVPEQYEFRVLRKDGTSCWMEVFATVITFRGKSAIQTAIIDITDRKQAEIDLHRAASIMHAVIESVSNGVLVINHDRMVITANQRFLDLWDLPADWSTLPRAEALKMIAERTQNPEAFTARSNELVDNLAIESSDIIDLRDGRILERYTGPYLIDGAISGRVYTYLEVTEQRLAQEALRQNEELFRSVSENSPVGIFMVDEQFKVIFANDEFCNMLGYFHYEILGTDIRSVLRDEDQAELAERYQRLHRGEQRESRNETCLVRKDGSTFWCESSAKIITDSNGQTRTLGLIIDITDRKQTEAQRLELALEREKVELLRQFIGNVSHDLKTPLTIIDTSLYLLERATDPRQEIERLNTIREQTQRLGRLIQDLLTMSRLDFVPELDRKPVEINHITRDVLQQFHSQIEHKNLIIQVQLPYEVPPILGDSDELTRAFSNLLENAINYTPAGGTLRLKLDTNNEYAVISIEDSGIGIDSRDLPYIFDRFYRADQARSTLGTGSGLGLAIVKRIIDLHNGFITVESQPGAGTIFRVSLPVQGEPVAS